MLRASDLVDKMSNSGRNAFEINEVTNFKLNSVFDPSLQDLNCFDFAQN